MSEMLNLIAGRLEIQPVLTPAFKGRFVTKNYLLTEGDEGDTRDARVPVVAWDNIAEEMMGYKKGDLVHLLCVPTDSMMQVNGNVVSVLGFRVLKIDHNQKILLEVNKKIMEILEME